MLPKRESLAGQCGEISRERERCKITLPFALFVNLPVIYAAGATHKELTVMRHVSSQAHCFPIAPSARGSSDSSSGRKKRVRRVVMRDSRQAEHDGRQTCCTCVWHVSPFFAYKLFLGAGCEDALAINLCGDIKSEYNK